MSEDLTQIRFAGAIRHGATSAPGDRVDVLALDGEHVVAGHVRRLDLATLREQPPKPLERPAPAPVPLVLDAEERILALAPERGLAITTLHSAGGAEVRVRVLATGKKRALAVCQRTTAAARFSPDGRFALVLDGDGGVLRYDLRSDAYPGSARARKPEPGKRACVDVARGGRLWLAATGSSIEVRLMNAEKATVDLAPVDHDVTCAMFLPDASGVVVGTARGVVMRFELLLDRIGSSREARVAAIADEVDAAMSEGRWLRLEPRVEVYDEVTEGGRTTLHFVADHYEYNHAQSGSDWAEHLLCAGHAMFEGDRRVDVQVTSIDRRRITERDDETYDARDAVAAFRAAADRARSQSST